MPQVRDAVCGMTIDPTTAAGQATYGGQTYYFCSARCSREFDADPGRYAGARAAGGAAAPERHEPPHTTSGGITAPKFGSAGSGGLEYERLPEAHDEDRDRS